MKMLLCVLMLSVSTLNFCMEPDMGEIALGIGAMALDGVTNVCREAANAANEVNTDVQQAVFGTTVEHGEYISQVMDDDCIIL